jgi:LmbE family N-acetylglucosaminyl deacetylase
MVDLKQSSRASLRTLVAHASRSSASIRLVHPGDHLYDRHVAEVLPHYRRRGDRLFFMISRRAALELSPDDILLYDAIDGRKTVAELVESHADARERLLTWRDFGIVALVPPLRSRTAPHLVVIEPHMDDAALSVGGRLLHRRGRCRITILSVVKRSNFTSYLIARRQFLHALNVEQITDLRIKESRMAARLLGAEFCCLDWTDAPLRFWPADRWSSETIDNFTVDAFTTFLPSSRDISKLAEALDQRVRLLAPDELWIPMGLGGHSDHRTTRTACITMLAAARGRFSGIPVEMYEDVPYDTRREAEQIGTALRQCGARVTPDAEDVTDVFDDKLHVVSVFASQFKPSAMEVVIRNSARHSRGTDAVALVERFGRIDGEVSRPPRSHLLLDSACIAAALRTQTRTLLKRAKQCRRLVVLALPSGHMGLWTDDRDRLLATFPNATVCAYVAESIAWQMKDGQTDRLQVISVPKGLWRWTVVCVRELIRFGTPTLVVARRANARDNWHRRALVRLLMPFRTVLFARQLNDFCQLLELISAPAFQSLEQGRLDPEASLSS